MASVEESKRSDSGSKVPAATEVSTTPSSWLSEEQNEEEEQVLEKPLTSAEAPAFASGSAAGGGNDDAVVAIEKEHMFDKVVTPSDVGKLNRLVIPKQHAEKYFPLEASSAKEKGLTLSFEDRSGKLWRFRYSYWNSSQSYVITKGWSRFVREKRLVAGDTISFSCGAGEAARGRLFIDCKRRADCLQSRDPHRMPRLPFNIPPPQPPPMHTADQPGPAIMVGLPIHGPRLGGSVPLRKSYGLHGFNPQQNRDLQQTEGSKARVRLNQAREPYPTHGSATIEELRVTADRLLPEITGKGTGFRGSSDKKPWRENDSSGVTKLVKRKMLDKNVQRFTFTTEEFFYSMERVEKLHFDFHKDVKAWINIKKQYEIGHTCMQQVVRKPHGRNDMEQMIMEKILLDTNGGTNCTVISIHADSGHGKTSLLHALYNDQQLMDNFDKRIWIQLSDRLDIIMLFRKIVEVAMNDHCSITNLECLQEMVKEEITDKKFLLFLDDADMEDLQFWSTVLQVLNTGAKGSAVIMATRSSTISNFSDAATHSYFLNPLSEESNLMLLQQYAVAGTDIQSNPDLLMVAQRFITRFGSNPLNLKAIGGLLCHADSISLELDKFEGNVIPLKLCHDVLPIHLKQCLAFCLLFPVGYIFDKHHMVPQWISHGCVRPAEDCELEDLGVEYFNELLCRSFFQYSPVHSDKDDKFVMHEFVYKVLESVSRDRYFKSEYLLSSIPANILHLSLASSQFQTIELMSKTEELNDLQTFMVVQPEWQPYTIPFPTLNLVGLDDFFLKFTSLEILDLSHTDTEELPGSIGGMRNLQYLSVNNTSIRTLPSEVCSLSNLQTLEAKDCRFFTELPGDTKKLLKLRHLAVTKELDYVHLPHGIGHLTELRTLPVFHASGNSSHCSISELGNLHNLRGCLWLSGLESVKTGSMAQETNLKDKHHLKDLTLQWHDGGIGTDDEDEDAENVAEQVLQCLQPHTNLQELAIRGYEGSSFPAWMQSCSSLPDLVSLTLDGCFNCTQFPAIAHLPSLKFLSVRKMYDVQILSNNIHGETKFPSLELLNLWEMYGLEELFEASEGDCPRLRKICVSRCPELKRLPRLHSLTELVLHCGGRQLPDIPELASLVSLKIEGFHGVRSFGLPAAAALAALKKLEIRSCRELSSVDGLSALTTVQRLKVAGCPKLVLPRTESLTT